MTKVEITNNIGFSRYSDIVFWCTQSCPTYKTSECMFDPDRWTVAYNFYFEDEQDAVAFTLRWIE